MAIVLRITKTIIGGSDLYEKKGKQGERLTVPLYLLNIENVSGDSYSMGVTRDTWKGLHTTGENRYDTNMECPPNKKGVPYRGEIIRYGDKGFRVRLYEEGIRSGRTDVLKGVGSVVREQIQIHLGPGNSEGCFLLTDDEQGRDVFEKKLLELIELDAAASVPNPVQIVIEVEERSIERVVD